VPPRKERVPVVFDTNVVVGYYLGHNPNSARARVFRLWRVERKLQLIISDEVIAEYFELLDRLSVAEPRVERLREALQQRKTVTHVNLGARHAISRDPDDDVLLATAAAGQAQFLITSDKDLLDIPLDQKRRFRFEIVTPVTFLMRQEL
jgi:uncharacterized protein